MNTVKFADLQWNEDTIKAVHVYFDNDWGVSIIKNTYSLGGSEGLYEFAVLAPTGKLHYDNPVANGGVVGYLTPEDIEAHMLTVMSWPPFGTSS